MEKPTIGSKWLVIDPCSASFERVLTVTEVSEQDFNEISKTVVFFDGEVWPEGPFAFWPEEMTGALEEGALLMPAPENNG